VGKTIEHANNSEFLGDRDKFKYLAIHGYERWQVDKEGKSRSGKSSEWIKDYTRKDSDPDYAMLNPTQRYTLDGLRRLTGLHGRWPSNDPMWIVRGLCVAPKDRKYVSRALDVLLIRGLVTLSNEPLRSLEVVEESRSSRDHSTVGGTERTDGEKNDSHSQIETEAKAAPKANPSVPKIQGKISVKPVVPPTLNVEEEEYALGLMEQWRFYKFPEDGNDHAVWAEMIREHAKGMTVNPHIHHVMAWMMFINNDGYWKSRIHSVKDFVRCYPKMHEQYLKCGGDDLAKALEVADEKYADEQALLENEDETFAVTPLPEEMSAVVPSTDDSLRTLMAGNWSLTQKSKYFDADDLVRLAQEFGSHEVISTMRLKQYRNSDELLAEFKRLPQEVPVEEFQREVIEPNDAYTFNVDDVEVSDMEGLE